MIKSKKCISYYNEGTPKQKGTLVVSVDKLLQICLEELCNLLKQVETGVRPMIDAVVAVGVECSLELLVCLSERSNVVYHVSQVNIVVGSAVHQQQMSLQLACVYNSRTLVVSLLVLLWCAHVTLGVHSVIETPVTWSRNSNAGLEYTLRLAH